MWSFRVFGAHASERQIMNANIKYCSMPEWYCKKTTMVFKMMHKPCIEFKSKRKKILKPFCMNIRDQLINRVFLIDIWSLWDRQLDAFWALAL